MKSETRGFKVSPAIIRHLIESQAGSIEKAILEAVMNGIDAGASRINIQFDSTSQFTVEDNGRGFESRDEVERYFEVFGFDHQTAAEQARGRQLGRFGLGRGQLMAFAATVWETNRIRLEVDIRNKALDYSLAEFDEPLWAGCRITANLYEPMTRVAIENAVRELRQQTRYSPVAIYVNGTRTNSDCAETRWTETTEEFHFLAKPNSETGVDVYNLGILVRRYSHHQLGLSGVLVSRPGYTFELNMARNDVLQSKCGLWKRAQTLFDKHRSIRRRTTQLCDSDRIAILKEMMCEAGDPEEYSKLKLIKDVRGRYTTLSGLQRYADGRVTVADRRGSQFGEAIHRERLAAVLAPDMLEWFGVDSLQSLVEALRRLVSQHQYPPAFEAVPFSPLAAKFSGEHRLLPRTIWSKVEAAQIKSLNHASAKLALNINRGARYHPRGERREVRLGHSLTAMMWTDGERYIAVQREFMKRHFARGPNGIATLLNVMVHEYLHREPDTDEHIHSPEFYEAYEDVMCWPHLNYFQLVVSTFECYQKARAKAGLPNTKSMAMGQDQIERVIPPE